MKGSLRKHVAKDGTVTWRVRVETRDAKGNRHQPQRTFETREAAQEALRVWRGVLATATRARRLDDPITREPRVDVPPGALSCLRAIVLETRELQALWQVYSPGRVNHVLRYIEECAQAGLSALTPLEAPAATAPGANVPKAAALDGYCVYRLLADGVPFYVGQSRNVIARVREHITQATRMSRITDRSVRTSAVRQALAEGKTLTFDIVATAPTAEQIRELERQWIIRLIAEGYTLANGALLS